MTGCQLVEYLYYHCDFCAYCKYVIDYGFGCYPCVHDVGYQMYVIGCAMLEFCDNPLI